MPSRPLVAIVDDDESLRDATSNLLQAAGFSTATFADAESFLQSGGRPRAACLVTDMRMPGMSGVQLHQHLVALGAPIPTVLVTAYASDATRSRARDAGIVCCLAKPFAPDELLECVRQALARATPKS
jgi:FixJ family two-component response regulator